MKNIQQNKKKTGRRKETQGRKEEKLRFNQTKTQDCDLTRKKALMYEQDRDSDTKERIQTQLYADNGVD